MFEILGRIVKKMFRNFWGNFKDISEKFDIFVFLEINLEIIFEFGSFFKLHEKISGPRSRALALL